MKVRSIVWVGVILLAIVAFGRGWAQEVGTSRVTISAPPATQVYLDGKLLGTTQGSRDFIIQSPTIVAGQHYVLRLQGTTGEKSISFEARSGNGIVVYGVATGRKRRGIPIGSKDYQIYPPPK